MPKRTWTDQKLIEAVQNSLNISEVIKNLNLSNVDANKSTIRNYIEKLNLNISHWQTLPKRKKSYSLEMIFIENSTFTKSHLKRKIIEYKLLEEKCAECNQGPTWNGKILRLQVDHINGINNDHRINNLRFLCPNCHSQTENYAGKNIKNKPLKINGEYSCEICNKPHSGRGADNVCNKCYYLIHPRFNWPNNEELTILVNSKSLYQLSNDLKVSAPALSKHLRKNNITYNSHRKKKTKIIWPTMTELIAMINRSTYIQVAKELGVSDSAIRARLRRADRIDKT